MHEQSTRRRSLFDFENGHTVCTEFTKINPGPIYTSDYIQKVKNEIDEWEQHLENWKDEKKEYLKEKKMLKSRIFDESILNPEQLDFLGSVSFDHYITEANKFLNRTRILIESSVNNNMLIKQKLDDVQEKIVTDIFK